MKTIHPDDLATTVNAWTKAHAAQTAFSRLLRVRGRDGTYRWFISRATPLRTEDGDVVRWVGTWSDVNDVVLAEGALRERERIYRAIGESIDFGIWVCAPDGRNTYASESFLKMAGITQQECSDFGWGDRLHPDDQERTIAAWQECVRSGGHWDIEHRFRGVDGRWHPVLARGVPVRGDDGKIVCWAGINLDISRLKAAEEALVDADRRKDGFLAFLASAMRSMLGRLSRARTMLRQPEQSREKILRRLGVIEARAGQLQRLLDDLHALTRLQAAPVTGASRSTDLAHALRAAVERQRGTFQDRGIPVVLDPTADTLEVAGGASNPAAAVDHLFRIAGRVATPGRPIRVGARRGETEAIVSIAIGQGSASPGGQNGYHHRGAWAGTDARRDVRHPFSMDVALLDGIVGLHRGSAEARRLEGGAGVEIVLRLPLVQGTGSST
jgi:PAS domain S-box-containing protein